MAIPKDLVAASATPIILSLLKHEDSYGYDIIQKVKTLSEGEIKWADGMLYPILHRLEKKGLIESYSTTAESGRKRKYYCLCEEGLGELKKQRDHWESLHTLLKRLQGEYECLS